MRFCLHVVDSGVTVTGVYVFGWVLVSACMFLFFWCVWWVEFGGWVLLTSLHAIEVIAW